MGFMYLYDPDYLKRWLSLLSINSAQTAQVRRDHQLIKISPETAENIFTIVEQATASLLGN